LLRRRGRGGRHGGERWEGQREREESDGDGVAFHDHLPQGERQNHPSTDAPEATLKKIAIAATLVLASLALPAFAQAPAWPAKPVKIIVGFPPGGSVDQVARIFAAQLTQGLGQQFVVENRTGASGSIGAQAVATSPPDGYTWGVVFDTHAVNPSLIPNIAFDTLKDLAPVMLIGTSPMALVA